MSHPYPLNFTNNSNFPKTINWKTFASTPLNSSVYLAQFMVNARGLQRTLTLNSTS